MIVSELAQPYLTSLQGKVPNARLGVAFDGQRLGMVAFSIVQVPGQYVEGKDNQGSPTLYPAQAAYSWFAETKERVGLRSVVEVAKEVFASAGLPSPSEFFMKGSYPIATTITRQLKRDYGIKVRDFNRKAANRWPVEEVIASVLDDIAEGVIRPAPEFQGRPEYEILNSALRNVRAGDDLDPLAEAMIYGFGWWSALERRKKYSSGFTNHRLW